MFKAVVIILYLMTGERDPHVVLVSVDFDCANQVALTNLANAVKADHIPEPDFAAPFKTICFDQPISDPELRKGA